MLDKKIEEAINKQINVEIYSSYLYYSMAAYFESLSLKGCSHWMNVQALEELTHTHKFVTFVGDRGGRVLMQPVDGPNTDWESPLAVFEDAYNHEVEVTGHINNLMDLALEERDHATVIFLQWFVTEQVEEEASTDEVVQKFKLMDKTEGGLFLLDQELAKRSFVLPQNLVGVF